MVWPRTPIEQPFLARGLEAPDSKLLGVGRFSANVWSETLKPRSDLYVLCVAVHGGTRSFETCWPVASGVLASKARRDRQGRCRFNDTPASRSQQVGID